MSAKQYRIIGMGGTFDHFHIGHQHFLEFAAGLAEEIWVGITIADLTKDKFFPQLIEPYEKREKSVADFLDTKKIRHKVFPLKDSCGPTLKNSPVEAVAVTVHTQKGGEIINTERKKLSLPELPLHVCDLLKDEAGEYISSTRIREGKINRQGKVYARIFAQNLTLDAEQRNFFQPKQGKLVQIPQESLRPKYVIGDIVLETFLQNHWPLDVGVFDGMNFRKEYASKILKSVRIAARFQNQAGVITAELARKLAGAHHSDFFQIEGEEDLAAVASVLIAPLGAGVYYGQPNEGIVEMVVTEELKEKFYSVLTG